MKRTSFIFFLFFVLFSSVCIRRSWSRTTTSNKISSSQSLEQHFPATSFIPKSYEHRVELGLYVDNSLWTIFQKRYGRTHADFKLRQYIRTILRISRDQLGQLRPPVDIRLTRTVIWKSPGEEWTVIKNVPLPPLFTGNQDFFGSTHSQTMSDRLCAAVKPRSNGQDHALLMTGRPQFWLGSASSKSQAMNGVFSDIGQSNPGSAGNNNNRYGISTVNSMCSGLTPDHPSDSDMSCSIVNGRDFGAYSHATMISQMLGRSLGIRYDGQENPCNERCCIMNPFGSARVLWSACSRYEYEQSLINRRHACLSKSTFANSSIEEGRRVAPALLNTKNNVQLKLNSQNQSSISSILVTNGDQLSSTNIVENENRNSSAALTLAGQDFPNEAQCHQRFGTCYRFLDSKGHEKNCLRLTCRSQMNGRIVTNREVRLDGSHCGPSLSVFTCRFDTICSQIVKSTKEKSLMLTQSQYFIIDHVCISGFCTRLNGLNPAESLKRRIDGGWSDWTSAFEGGCSQDPQRDQTAAAISNQQQQERCSPCIVTNQMPIQIQIRRCDSPYPSNGGRYCQGSAIRAVSCSTPSSQLQLLPQNLPSFHSSIGSGGESESERTCKSRSARFLTKYEYALLITEQLCRSDRPKFIRGNGCVFLCFSWPQRKYRKLKFPNGAPCGDRALGGRCAQGECLQPLCGTDQVYVGAREDCTM